MVINNTRHPHNLATITFGRLECSWEGSRGRARTTKHQSERFHMGDASKDGFYSKLQRPLGLPRSKPTAARGRKTLRPGVCLRATSFACIVVYVSSSPSAFQPKLPTDQIVGVYSQHTRSHTHTYTWKSCSRAGFKLVCRKKNNKITISNRFISSNI